MEKTAKMRTRTASLPVAGVLLIGMLIALSVNAFMKGENRLLNSDFEADNASEPPEFNCDCIAGGIVTPGKSAE